MLREEPIAFYLCHCTDCQAESGSAFGQSMHVRREALDSVEGEMAQHTIEGNDGRRVIMNHCPNCLTVLWAENPEIQQLRGLNSGTLENTGDLEPYGNMWTRSARSWASMAPGPCFEQQPDDPLAMVRAWQERPQRSR
jgi:hypothetical protein